jgi:hypothetical protein
MLVHVEFAVSLKGNVDKMSDARLLCAHRDLEEVCEDDIEAVNHV